MGKRDNFTAERVANFNFKPSKAGKSNQTVYWDGKTPGLGLRVTPGGAKSYIFEARLHGKTLRLTIGDIRTWAIGKAQAEVTRLKTLTDQGIDPRQVEADKRQLEADKRSAADAERVAADAAKHCTLTALLDAYVRYLEAKGKSRSAAATKSAFKCHVSSNPAIASSLASAVTSRQIAELIRSVQEAGKNRAAGILRSYISAAYNAAKKAPLDGRLPAELIPFGIEHNPAEAVPAIPVNAGSRTLSAKELKSYMAMLGDSLPDMALKIALFAGGQRMAQLLRAKIGDFDADNRTLRLFDPKGKRKTPREHLLPLAPMAAGLVTNLVKRTKTTKSSWLFAATSKTVMAEETPGKRAAAICAELKVEQFNLRDIRRTCETMMAGMGIGKDLRSHLLSHGLSGVQSTHYDRHEYFEEKRAALVAWEAELKRIMSGTSRKSSRVSRARKTKQRLLDKQA